MSKRSKKYMAGLQRAMILDVYNMYDTDDVSTERLLAMVADTVGCDIDEVVDALVGSELELQEQAKKKRGNEPDINE